MRNTLLSILTVLLLAGATAHAQLPDLHSRKWYVIEALVDTPLKFADWETPADSNTKKKELAKYVGEGSPYFVQPYSDEEEEPKYVQVYWGNVHLMDYNGDGHNDIIYQSFLGMTAGHHVRFFRGTDKGYVDDYRFWGMLVEFRQDKDSFTFRLYTYPCCDGYKQELQTFRIDKEGLHLVERLLFVESNLATRLHNLPEKLQHDPQAAPQRELKQESTLYFRARKDIRYARYEAPLADTLLKQFFPFATFPAGTPVKVLAVQQGEQPMYLVRVSATAKPTSMMRHVARSYRKLDKYLTTDEAAVTNYLGWVRAGDLKPEKK